MTINIDWHEYMDLWRFKMHADVIMEAVMKKPEGYTMYDILEFMGYEEESKTLKEIWDV